jgi:hypothetical protein
MGVDTIAKVTGNPSVEVLVEGMKTIPAFSKVELVSYKEASTFEYKEESTGKTITAPIEATARINVSVTICDVTEERSIFVIEDTYDKTEGSSTAPFTTDHYTYLCLGHWGFSCETMESICGIFGGILIPDDCADEDSTNFFRIINSDNKFVLDTETLNLFNSLKGMSAKDKLEFVKKIKDNKDILLDFLKTV